MQVNELSTYKFNASSYLLDESNYLVATKDDQYPDRNIIPLFYNSTSDDMVLDIDEEEIGRRIFVKRGNDNITQDMDTRFLRGELFKLFKGPINSNDRYEFDHNVPKRYTYKNKLQPFSANEIVEIFSGKLNITKGSLHLENNELIELISNTYIKNNQVLFVEDQGIIVGPFVVKRSDTGHLILEKNHLFNNFGIYNFPSTDYIEIIINGQLRKILHNIESISNCFSEEFDFSTDEEVIHWFNNELNDKGSSDFDAEELNNLTKTIQKVITNQEIQRNTKRYERLSKILSTTKELVISKQKLLEIIPELDMIKSQIEEYKLKDLELRNAISEKIKESEKIDNELAGFKDRKLELEREIGDLTDRKDEQFEKLKVELEYKILTLNKQKEQLDEEIRIERENKSQELNQLKMDISFQERTKDELKRGIEILKKEFIEDQKNAQEKLVELVRHKTHFDFISGRDLLNSSDGVFVGSDHQNQKSLFSKYQEFRDSIAKKLNAHQRYFPQHFIDNLLISVFQNTLTLFAGLPGTGKTSLAKMLTEILSPQSRIKEVSVGRGWTSQKDLVGFSNPISKTFFESHTGLYSLLKQLNYEWENKMYMNSPLAFVILDEANLSPMEHYWSTFYNLTDSIASELSPLKIDLGQNQIISYANTMRFIGTINYDQTTEDFSPRILDRVNIIKLRSSGNQIDSITTKNIDSLRLEFQNAINFFGLLDFNQEPTEIVMHSKLKDKYEEIKTLFDQKLNIYISPRVEIAIKRYCLVANTVMTEEYRALDYCIAQRLLPLVNIQGNKKNELEELKNMINGFKLEDSVSLSILEDIIKIGSKQGYTKDNFNYFLTLTHV